MAGDFYIGYRRQAPAGLARFARRIVAALAALVAGVAAILAAGQRPFDPGTFEYGVRRAYEGRLIARPYPLLAVPVPQHPLPRLFFLVAPGKHGAQRLVEGSDGRRVRLEGSLIERGGAAMIEVVPGSLRAVAADGGPPPPAAALGTLTLRGEIVDSKCFLGVMKPGREKPHRSCASRCLAGGIPPLLWVPAGDDGYTLLLVDARGRPHAWEPLRDLVAEPVEVEGRVERLGETLVLAADAAAYRRLR